MKLGKALKTSGDLRKFLYETMEKVSEGTIDARQAMTAAKLAAQINESLKVEVELSIRGQALGYTPSDPGAMPLYSERVDDDRLLAPPSSNKIGARPRDITAVAMGDPPPGRSALDQKKHSI